MLLSRFVLEEEEWKTVMFRAIDTSANAIIYCKMSETHVNQLVS